MTDLKEIKALASDSGYAGWARQRTLDTIDRSQQLSYSSDGQADKATLPYTERRPQTRELQRFLDQYDEPILLVSGETGMGKSAWLARVSERLLEGDIHPYNDPASLFDPEKLAVILTSAEDVENKPDCFAPVEKFSDSVAYIEAFIDAGGEVIILIDNLDRIRDPQAWLGRHIVGFFNALSPDNLDSVKFVLSGQPDSFDNPPVSYDEASVAKKTLTELIYASSPDDT